MINSIRAGVWVLLGMALPAWAAAPVVSNVYATQQAGSKWVDITYDVASSATNVVTVSVVVSNATGVLTATHFSGDVGIGVATGAGRKIVWDGGADQNGQILSSLQVCLTASVGGGAPVPPLPDMVLIPSGSFTMGSSASTPLHPVTLSAFYLDRTEVTKAAWDTVAAWAVNNGYTLCNAAGKAASHPAQYMDWHNAVRWCNARSEMEGLTPCYTNADGTLFKAGSFAGGCDWSANGYRLPTEAEWEYAARGTGTTNHFPWTDSNEIQHARANYWSSSSPSFDTSPTRGYHPAYTNGAVPYTSPAGSFAPNAYGLCDMAGNVFEWCWDLYKAPYLTSPILNPRGAATGTHRVIRGGSWGGAYPANAWQCDVAYRNISTPDGSSNIIGFRCAKAAPPSGASADLSPTPEATGAASAPLAVEPVTSAPFNADFRDYTLTVNSACGSPTPAVGTRNYAWHSTVTGAVSSVFTAGGTNWTCAGWTGTGCMPSGTATNTGPVLLTAPASSITWLWTVVPAEPETPDSDPAVAFVTNAVLTSGEGASGVGTFNAVASLSGVGPMAVTVYAVPASATAADYLAPSKPAVLIWADGETGTKQVTLPIKGDRLAEGNEVFYLALGAPSNGVISQPSVCAVTITDDDAGTVPNRGVFVAGLPQPPEGGKVAGNAFCLPGRAVKLTATANAGWTFLGWEDGSQTAAHTVSGQQAAAAAQNGLYLSMASFKRTAELALPLLAKPGDQSAMVGLAFNLPLSVASECLPKVTVTGLPAGLRYDAATASVVGVPTKTGVFNVTVTASNPKGSAVPQSFTIAVAALPAWAQGTFNGAAGTAALGSGTASMSVTPLGGVSGKLTLRGTNFGFSASSYLNRDASGALWLTATAKVSKASFPLTLAVCQPAAAVGAGTAPESLGKAEGTFGADGWVLLYRNVWKEPALLTVITNTFTGYYTATLPGGEACGSGYLTFTVDKLGGVKTVGKLADGTAVSLSGPLILDEAGRVFAMLYAAPTAYKGGCLFGVAEFVTPESGPVVVQLLDDPISWSSLNPLATGDHGAGFSREIGLTGGWYGKLGNLYDYYRGTVLSVGSNAGAPAPAFLVGTNSYSSVCWNPNGLVLSVATNSLSVMTGLTAPKAGLPVKVGGAYEYDTAVNPQGLTLALTRATGIFKGTFKAWFDYAATHTPKSLAFEGVITPERQDKGDGVEGRGFYLWSTKAQYSSPTGKPVPYTFSWSYDFLILGS